MSPAAKSRTPRQDGSRRPLPPARSVVRRARELARETSGLLKRKGRRVSAAGREAVAAGLADLEAELPGRGRRPVEVEALLAAVETLDGALEAHFGSFRKTMLREYVEAIAWAIALALLIRSFIFEAFSIPSGSMLPTLEIGDRLFVDKASYGLYVPFSPRRLIHWDEPGRGDIIVFQFHCEGDPNDGEDYIKRVVAVAGDRVRLESNVLHVNGEPVQTEALDPSSYRTDGGGEGTCALYDPNKSDPTDPVGYCHCVQQQETVGDRVYTTQHMTPRGPNAFFSCRNDPEWPLRNPGRGGPCGYFGEASENPEWPDVTIPEGHVFVMGDNRDRSEDGRFWGVVPYDMIKGRAFVIWWPLTRLFTWLG